MPVVQKVAGRRAPEEVFPKSQAQEHSDFSFKSQTPKPSDFELKSQTPAHHDKTDEEYSTGSDLVIPKHNVLDYLLFSNIAWRQNKCHTVRQ